MNTSELHALGDVANQVVRYHSGLWGGPAGYRRGKPADNSTDTVAAWEQSALDLLVRQHLVAFEPRLGVQDALVIVTDAGRRALLADGELAA